MAVRFIVGRAGTGKTAHCLNELRRELIASPLDGPPLLLLVPEQASLQMERALIETPGLEAYHRCQVLSFARLAQQVLAELDPSGAARITPYRRLMLVALLLSRPAGADGERPSFEPVSRSIGFQRQLSDLFEHLLAHGVRPEQIARCASQADDLPQLHRRRLEEVARLFDAYLKLLAGKLVDPAEQCTRAAELMARATRFFEARVWVDGFSGFNGSESALLLCLARAARHVDVTLLLDPDSAVLSGEGGPVEPYELFAPTARTYLTLSQACHQAGIPLDEPLLLRPRTPWRFAAGSPLAVLEEHIFAEPAGHAKPIGPDDCVTVLECPDRRTEVEEVARRIRHLVAGADQPTRYRHVAVVARDLDPYADLIAAAFAAFGIPCFIDRRQPVGHHPLVQLIRGLMAVAEEDFSIDAVGGLLKCGLLPIPDDRLDELENYLLAHGICGRTFWTGGDWSFRPRRSSRRAGEQMSASDKCTLERVNFSRRRLLELLAPWIEPPQQTERTGPSEFGRRLFDCLSRLEVERQLEALAVEAEADGLIDQANLHRQLYSELITLLDDLHEVLSDAPQEPLSLPRWAEIVDAAMSSWTIGLAPPTLDQVLVGSIERSRHPEVRVIFLIGLNQGLFPANPPGDTILTDAHRTAMADAGVDLGPTRRQQTLDERLLAYIAVTRPSRQLCISFAASDEQGRPLEPSPYLQAVMAALPGLTMQRIQPSSSGRNLGRICHTQHLTAALAADFATRAPEASEDPDPAGRARMNDLYEAARQRPGLAEPLRHALSALAGRGPGRLSPEAARKLFEPGYSLSISALESYASCPFQHFSRYGLRLQERPSHRLEALDLGLMTHSVLEKLFDDLLSSGDSLESLPEEDLIRRVRDAGLRALAELGEELVVSQGRRDYLLARGERELLLTLADQRRALGAGRFRPRRSEVAFGFPDDPRALPALRIDSPGGRELVVRGRIDRVDLADLGTELAGVVIDYKRGGEQRLSLTRLLHGLQLQLVGYLLALREVGESLAGRPIRPGGAFYANLLRPYRSVAHPSDVSAEKLASPNTGKLKGAFDEHLLPALDDQVQPGRWSSVVSAYVATDGRLGHRNSSDALASEEFAGLLRHARRKIGELGDAILDGTIEVRPYLLRGTRPCTWCAYNSVCRFEFATGQMRNLPSYVRQEALDLISAKGASHAGG